LLTADAQSSCRIRQKKKGITSTFSSFVDLQAFISLKYNTFFIAEIQGLVKSFCCANFYEKGS